MRAIVRGLLPIGLCFGLFSAPLSPSTVPQTASAAPPHPLRFAVIGDYGLAGQPEADVARDVHDWNPDLLITVGDNNYTVGSAATIDANIGQYYHDYIGNYTGAYGAGSTENRFFPCPGNHDWMTDSLRPYLDYFTLPGNERYYQIRRGPVEFFFLDSDPHEPDGVTPESTQGQWLQSALAASASPWKIVVLHHAPYTSGPHQPDDWMRWPFAAWGAQVVLSGHDHTYERLEIDGIPYIVNGLGGHSSRYSFPSILPESLARYNTEYGFLAGEATEDQLSFSFQDRTGNLIDPITLNRAFPLYLPLLTND